MSRMLELYRSSAVEASKAFWRSLPVIPGMLACYFVLTWLGMIAGPLGMAGGFILGAVFIALLTLYYSWVSRSLDRERIRFNDLLVFDTPLFFQLISVAFIFWIVFEVLLKSFAAGTGDVTLILCAKLAAFLVFNCLPEILYRNNQEGIAALTASFEFTKEHYIEWFLPVVFFLCWPLLTVPKESILLILAGSQALIPFKLIFDAWPGFDLGIPVLGPIISLLLPVAVAHWFMLFRGRIFEKLNSGFMRRSF